MRTPADNKAESGHPGGHGGGQDGDRNQLRLVAWEITRSCNLSCIHCRASAELGPYPNELTTGECKAVLEDIASFSDPIIIFTGGEPLLRKDIFEIVAHGQKLGMNMAMAVNGLLLDDEIAQKMVDNGIQRISVSLDGATAETHDIFRSVPGAFEGAMRGIEAAKRAGLAFQINSTVTKMNVEEIPDLLKLAVDIGAVAHHIFLLVPTGRGKDLEAQEIPPEEYERTLNWFYDQRENVPIQLKATCAPHYYRILRQRAEEEGKQVTLESHGMDAMTRGCLGGTAFCFISHVGQLSPCGYLELDCGNVRKEGFRKAWEDSKIFGELRDYSKYEGKCGGCRYLKVCGGCRARAYAATGNYMAEEPYCVYPGHG